MLSEAVLPFLPSRGVATDQDSFRVRLVAPGEEIPEAMKRERKLIFL